MRLIPALQADLGQQAATHARACRAEAALAAERKARAQLEELVTEADAFCQDVAKRFVPMRDAVDITSWQKTRAREGCDEPWACQDAASLYHDTRAGFWQEDTSHCTICNAEFQAVSAKKRRHHCRICGRCVCTACSPSSVKLRGYEGMERACNPCISFAQRSPAMRSAAMQVAGRLKALCAQPGPEDSELETLPEALAYCEHALGPLERLMAGDGKLDLNEAGVAELRSEVVRIRRQLEDGGDHLAAAQDASGWAADSAVSLQARLAMPLPRVHDEMPENPCEVQRHGEIASRSVTSTASAAAVAGAVAASSAMLPSASLLAASSGTKAQEENVGAGNPFESGDEVRARNPFESEVSEPGSPSNPFTPGPNEESTNPFSDDEA